MSETIKQPIGLLGGTFDPIHHGHLRMALEAYYKLQLDHIKLIPLKNPVHRNQTVANPEQRSDMIKLAIDNITGLILDERELNRESESYTIDTLQSLRKDYKNAPLCLLMGRDSFSTLDQWKQWQQLLDYAHIIIASRHENSIEKLNPALELLLQSHETHSFEDLHKKTNGFILQMQIPLLDISSSDIRDRIKHNQQLNYLLPEKVIDYIKQSNLYD